MQKQAKASEGKRLSPEEISIFCEQAALVLQSGIPLNDGMEALCLNYRDSVYGENFARLQEALNESGFLLEGLKAAGIFPAYMVQMVRIGEKTGNLDTFMDELATYYLRESRIRRSVVNAVVYPLLLLLMMSAVIGILVLRVLPVFEEVLRGFGVGQTASMATRIGLLSGKVVLVLTVVLILGGLLLFLWVRLSGGGKAWHLITKLFPPIRRVVEKLTATRFSSAMAMMLSGGFPMEEAAGLINDVFTDGLGREKVVVFSESLLSGSSFSAAVDQSQLFEPLYNRMIKMGVLAGKTDGVLRRIAQVYEEELDASISHLVSLIEPSLVALLSIVIGGILLSVMLPLAGIMAGMS